MATAPKTDTKKPATIPAIRVRSCSPMNTLRRAGEEFSRDARTIPLAELTDDQVARIRKEPLLVVEDVEIPVEPATEEQPAT